MNKVFKNRSDNKQPYESPEIKVLDVELEHSIAAGSAKVFPGTTTGEIKDEWILDEDEERTFQW